MPKNTQRGISSTEHQEQAALFSWAELMSVQYPALRLLFAIPNGAHKSPAMAQKFKAEGLKPGVPDVCLPVARGPFHGLFVEMKRTKGGLVSDEQEAWIEALRESGYFATVCQGWTEAAYQIEAYLKLAEERN